MKSIGPLDNKIVIHDERFSRLTIGHIKLERLWTGCRWAEGPAYFPAGRYLVWSDIPNDRILRFDETDASVSVFRAPCQNANGATRDAEGRLISCEHRARRVTRTEHDGSIKVLADHFEGKRLNSPNDVIVHSDGGIWFSDPTYGIDSDYEGDCAHSEIGASNVYRIDPKTGAVDCKITDRVKPNGLAFSPDERLLYVADTGATHQPGLPAAIYAYPINAEGVLDKPHHFATCGAGFFDGFRFDQSGHLWTSAGPNVFCYAPDGTHIGTIEIGELVANLCFGGPKRNRLYIAAQTSLYAIFLNTRGAL